MKSPYFYIIKHIPTGTYYAGCKMNKEADSSNLMTPKGYKTTSKIVKRLIKTDGLDSFIVLKVKHFTKPEQALIYETRFLTKVNAAENTRFLNKHNGGKNFTNKGGYVLSESTKNKMRKPKSEETIKKQNEEKMNRSSDVYKKMVQTRKSKGLPWVSDEQKEKIKNFNSKYWNDENRKLQKERMIEFYKNNPISDASKEKRKKLFSGENNAMFGKSHSKEARDKMKKAWERRKLKKI
jgi:alpha-D-ribose 1-methylphosphonate 5-triphosphate diphosphatase PhnM